MAFSKKTWKDRIVQYLNRRRLTDVDTGDIRTVTVTRDEGGITEDGDIFNAATMNDLEDRIDAAFDGLTAADIPYSSGVSVADKLGDLNGLVKIVFSGNISKTLTANQNLGILGTEIIPTASMPSGYTVIGLLSSYSTNNNCIMYSYDTSAVGTSGTFCFIKNNTASSQSIIVNYRILFMKSAYVS